jgi:hypothetical protein
MIYYNAAQKYILALLNAFGPLKQTQLEILTKVYINKYLKDIGGYLAQLRAEHEIVLAPCGGDDVYISLRGEAPDRDTVAAFDVLIDFAKDTYRFDKGEPPVILKLYRKERHEHEISVFVVNPGQEDAISQFVKDNLTCEAQMAIFLVFDQTQMQKVDANSRHAFALKQDNGISYFREE